MKTLRVRVLALVLSLPLTGPAQFNLGYRYAPLAIEENGSNLPQSTVGGLNTPQFSHIDLDGNSVPDLVVYDRSGGVIKTFLFDSGSKEYLYAPQYESQFPENVNEFLFLKDYNCDGFADLFTYFQGGFRVYRNLGVFPLEWVLASNKLQSDYGSIVTNILVLGGDVPAIVDVDSDGDPDILTFGNANSENSIEYHRNRSMEDFGHCDSLKFKLETQCWGNVEEPNNSSSLVQKFCKGMVPPGNGQRLHPGSSVLLIDTDADGDRDLIVGDIQTDRFVFAPNIGDAQAASIDVNQQTTTFPASDPVRMDYLTAGYEIDIDQDGIYDLVASVNNTIDSSCNDGNTWYYRNTSPGAVNYVLQTKDFLLEDMLDLGEGTCPAFMDVDGDGLDDLVVASSFRKTPTTSRKARLAYFRNKGTASSPAYELVDDDFANLSGLSLTSVCPAFGNLDGDSDLEMLLGTSDGTLYLFENFPVNGVANFVLDEPFYQGINSIGFNAAPQIEDLNNDGLPDLVVGEKTGILSYFENQGTQASPSFTPGPTIAHFGKVDVSHFCCSGHAVPRFVEDPSFGPGRFLFIGTDEQVIKVYEIPQNLNDSFALRDSIVLNEGRITPALADITGDNNPELVIGTRAGGLKYFKRDANYPIGTAEPPRPFTFHLYPNPARERVNIRSEQDIRSIELYTLSGSLVLSKDRYPGKFVQLSTGELAPGFYLLRVHAGQEHRVRALIIAE